MISRFRGEYDWLSNFYPCEVRFEGVVYPTLEHAYQAAKTVYAEEREEIRQAPTPGHAKRRGQAVTSRPEWDELKRGIMLGLLYQKFQHPYLKQKLLDTGIEFIAEANDWGDTYWGTCKGVGENHLGLLLMQVRVQLMRERLEQNKPI